MNISPLPTSFYGVPTPLNKHREPDLSFVIATTESIRQRLRCGQLIVLESTTYPGTTAEVLKPILDMMVSNPAMIFSSPTLQSERIRNTQFSTANIPKIVGGDGAQALELVSCLYQSFIGEVVRVECRDCGGSEAYREHF